MKFHEIFLYKHMKRYYNRNYKTEKYEAEPNGIAFTIFSNEAE